MVTEAGGSTPRAARLQDAGVGVVNRPDHDLVVPRGTAPRTCWSRDRRRPAFGQQEKLVDGISLVIGEGSAASPRCRGAGSGCESRWVRGGRQQPAATFMLDQLDARVVESAVVAVREDVHRDDGGASRDGTGHLDRAGPVASADRADVPESGWPARGHVHAVVVPASGDCSGRGEHVSTARSARVMPSGHNWDTSGRLGQPDLSPRFAQAEPAAVPTEPRWSGWGGGADLPGRLGWCGGPRVVRSSGASGGALCAEGSVRAGSACRR